MIQRIGANFVTPSYLKNVQNTNGQVQQNIVTNSVQTKPNFNYTSTQLVNAYQALHGIIPAKTVSFGHLSKDFANLRADVYTCRDDAAGRKGEKVGQGRENVKELLKSNKKLYDELDKKVREYYDISDKKVQEEIVKKEK